MTAQAPRDEAGGSRAASDPDRIRIDTGKPHPARVYDYLLGGKDHYAVDREVGEKLPQEAKDSTRQNRAFMHRAAAWVAGRGIDQFLDIGTGIPTEPNLHQTVQAVVPAARVAYTDNDPIVLRHAEALLVSTPQGATDYIQADVREPQEILAHSAQFLDLSRPVCLSLIALMHFVPEEQDPYGLVRTLTEALCPGSYLILTHATFDFTPEVAEQVNGAYRSGRIDMRFRPKDRVEPFFEGLDLVPPGLVQATKWGTPEADGTDADRCGVYAGVARVR